MQRLSERTVHLLGVMVEGFGRGLKDAQLEAYSMALADLNEEAVNKAILRAIKAPGEHPPPPGELAQSAKQCVPPVRLLTTPDRGAEPTFRCRNCRDSGLAHVLNPQFVRAYRKTFEAMTDADFRDTEESSWWQRMRLWWHAQRGRSPIDAVMVCNCQAGERRSSDYARINTNSMPVLHGTNNVRRVLADWYAEGGQGGVVVWDVPEQEAF